MFFSLLSTLLIPFSLKMKFILTGGNAMATKKEVLQNSFFTLFCNTPSLFFIYLLLKDSLKLLYIFLVMRDLNSI